MAAVPVDDGAVVIEDEPLLEAAVVDVVVGTVVDGAVTVDGLDVLPVVVVVGLGTVVPGTHCS